MAKENKKGGMDDENLRMSANQNQSENDNEQQNALSPEEYLAMEENGNMNEYLFPEKDLPPVSDSDASADKAKDKQKDKAKDKAPAVSPAGPQAKGNKGKLLTTDGLEYD